MSVPIIVGVTGHRDLREKDIPKLQELVAAELKKLMERYPHSEFVLLDSIASGADTLCADAALALGIKLVCPLPMPVEEYRRDFSKTDAAVFDALLQQAAAVFVVPNTEPLPEVQTRNFHYRQAGLYVALHSHVLLALWDGSAAEPDGCGTAEIVSFTLRGNDKDSSHFKAENSGAVLHIYTPRQSADAVPSVCLLESEPGSLHATLHRIDAFNADAGNVQDSDADTAPLISEENLSQTDQCITGCHDL